MKCSPQVEVHRNVATSCMYYGTVYEDGAQFPASDGCNTCYCSHAQAGCTKIICFSIDGVGRRDTEVTEEVIPQL
ncbi:hypothetical protein CHS0354_022533 [Potamilus streckersoni]|uniref:VWFC domain-containing protein n=1 Tax=Potamilus streckersoni TaxID=2493646 RepID=A0AAE0SEG9_9BIVA|nr:hypothetical protein CHS0354_022533 [Potamilus streckersoni]